MERRRINLFFNKEVMGQLTSSISKLNSIQEIVDFEYKQLGGELRLVILTDYIRKEFYTNAVENELELNKIGVLPIFEILRRDNTENKKMAVLTGSLIIIPKSSFLAFKTKALECGITKVKVSAVPYDEAYFLVHQSGQLKNDMIHIITQIFQEGEIEVLIGTKSLLGEGWDAPAINSLILASFVGSFVLSNQMRGRAIRSQNGNPAKTGNIWHLVCVDPTSPSGGSDFDLLKRRFRSFVGVSLGDEPGIENGVGRLNLPEGLHQKDEVDKKNLEIFTMAGDRVSLKQRWVKALETGKTLIEEIKIPFPEEKKYQGVKSLYFKKTIGNLIATLTSGLVAFGWESLGTFGRAARSMRTLEDVYLFLTVMGGVAVAIFGGLTVKTLRLYWKYRDISKDIHQIGVALLHSLEYAGAIHTDIKNLTVETSVNDQGAIFCHLNGGTTFEKSAFINALKEIIERPDNPRYVVIRNSIFMFFVEQKDYHAVPETLGKNKRLAEFFSRQWESLVGSCDLIFARSIEGRKILLKSRMKSLAAQLDDKVEHVNKWK